MLRDLDRDEIVTSVGWSRRIRALGMKLLEGGEGGRGGAWRRKKPTGFPKLVRMN